MRFPLRTLWPHPLRTVSPLSPSLFPGRLLSLEAFEGLLGCWPAGGDAHRGGRPCRHVHQLLEQHVFVQGSC